MMATPPRASIYMAICVMQGNFATKSTGCRSLRQDWKRSYHALLEYTRRLSD